MAFIGIILFMLPVFVAMFAFFISMFFFIGTCLLIIGITGISMNRIYAKQMKTQKKVSGTFYNSASLIAGSLLILFPLGYALLLVISTFLK